jgi:3-deoxy-D-manno-octulosonate 8-phosphate phosphatase (KDO 8-P phosphatase)
MHPRVSEAIPAAVAGRIRLLILDVDGILTDAGVYLGEGPDGSIVELKRFDIQDGLGIRLLQDAGIEVALVSGRVSSATALRARELGIRACHQDPGAHKLPVVDQLRQERDLPWEALAMLGDDLPDIPVLERVGLPMTAANGVPEVRAMAHWCAPVGGGRGAVRAAAEALLRARGVWEASIEAYLATRRRL